MLAEKSQDFRAFAEYPRPGGMPCARHDPAHDVGKDEREHDVTLTWSGAVGQRLLHREVKCGIVVCRLTNMRSIRPADALAARSGGEASSPGRT